MPEHYDSMETRDPAVREREQLARLSEIVTRAMTAPGWAKHLSGVNPKAIISRAALAGLPVLRKSDISALQKEHPPFGGTQCYRRQQSATSADVAGPHL